MPEETYFVAVDGRQLDGEHDMSQVRQICTQYAGRQVMVWNEALGSWTDPKTLPTFRVSAAPAPAPAPAPAAPSPAPAPSPYAPAPRATHPAAAAGAAAGGVMAEDAGALKGLLDFRFETFVAPKLIRLLYVIIMVLAGLAALGGILSGLQTMVSGIRFGMFFMIVTGLVMIVLGPLIAVFYLALMRVLLEGVHVLFQLKDKLAKD